MIKVHRYVNSSVVNGPGKRFVLWVQGCPKECPGCFNQKASDGEGGILFEPDHLFTLYEKNGTEGVTISGGEPFLQAPQLLPLVRLWKTVGLNIMVYSGLSYNELKMNALPGSRELLREIDLLVDGPYLEQILPDGEWVGSGNQRVIALSQKGIEMKSQRRSFVEQEYIISRTGVLSRTGI